MHPGEAVSRFPADIAAAVHGTARVVEVVGVAVIAFGILAALVLFIRQLMGPTGFNGAYRAFRGNLGRGILLGLEFLVAADIIGTVAMEPTFGNLGVLAVIVLIRTFLSFTLEVEIDGHWPWQESRRRTESTSNKV